MRTIGLAQQGGPAAGAGARIKLDAVTDRAARIQQRRAQAHRTLVAAVLVLQIGFGGM